MKKSTKTKSKITKRKSRKIPVRKNSEFTGNKIREIVERQQRIKFLVRQLPLDLDQSNLDHTISMVTKREYNQSKLYDLDTYLSTLETSLLSARAKITKGDFTRFI